MAAFFILGGRWIGRSDFAFLFLEKSVVKVNGWPMSKLLGMFIAGNNSISFLQQKVLVFN